LEGGNGDGFVLQHVEMLAAFLRKKFKPSQTQIFYIYRVIANRADQAINRHAQCQ
jgi:hypothetical protein